ncbi:hypothetical protein CHS0354_029728 [Potamilus streckersoni]|uniref:Gamma-secretase-activating protein C-terminal domain-containing protein n=1 Tax=Potamilus streckersoni TaxID=2493646 RepID=A0AAE0VIU3_9BIVA|nr:hypothetical protein CHS0354_029728 [Potamilus streckersoni]
MVAVTKILDLRESIENFLLQRRAELKLPSPLKREYSIRVLNQEKDGCLLYTWDEITAWSQSVNVTHFGQYDPDTQRHQVLYIYNQCVHVVSASINQQRTLLAFTTYDKNGEVGRTVDVSKRSSKGIYSVFLAEIKAKNARVFSLNLERPMFLKAQFLYIDSDSDKESRMIVFLHRESVGLYSIPLTRVLEKGIVMRGQPKTEQIVKKFVWCQWDAVNQRLFYIYFRSRGDEDKDPILACLQFYSNARHDNMLEVPLNFPFPGSKHFNRVAYDNVSFHPGIPDRSLRLCVLTQPNGTFCVCYQQQHSSSATEHRSKSSPRPPSSPLLRTSSHQQHISPFQIQSSPTALECDSVEINYYICMVHHAKTLHGTVSGMPNSVRRLPLHFSWLGDNLLVILPGYFVHILNVSIEFEPCHHILLHSKTCPFSLLSSVSTSPMSTKALSQMVTSISETGETLKDKTTVSMLSSMLEGWDTLSSTTVHGFTDQASGGYLLDTSSYLLWKMTLNTDSLLQVFAECYMSTTRAAILHYMVVRLHDLSLLKQLFEIVCNDICSFEVPSLMGDFFMGMTYVSMRGQMDKELMRLIPFTVTETFRGQFDKTPNRERLAKLSYSSMHSVKIGTKAAKERHQKHGGVTEDMWDILQQHLHWMQHDKAHRFSQETVKQGYQQLLISNTGLNSGRKLEQGQEQGSFLNRLHSSLSKPDVMLSDKALESRRLDSILGTPPQFLYGLSVTETSEQILSLTKELLCKHIKRYTRKESKLRAESVAKEYVNCQVQQSRLLCHLLWSLRGRFILSEEQILQIYLPKSKSLEELELFQLLERYSLVLTDLAYPVPQRFPAIFTSVAFRCLDFHLFLQYADRGVLQLTADFMVQLLTNVSDTDEGCKIKHQIISRLSQSSSEECLKQWGQSSCSRYFAHQQTAESLMDYNGKGRLEFYKNTGADTRQASGLSSTLSSTSDSVSFPPLSSFLQMLEQADPEKPYRRHRQQPQHLEMQILEDVALHHTSTHTNYNMSTVNF